jgi:hypothetical protein
MIAENRHCSTCHQIFQPVNSHHIYCTFHCRPSTKPCQPNWKVCLNCEAEFNAPSNLWRCCSKKCKTQYAMKRSESSRDIFARLSLTSPQNPSGSTTYPIYHKDRELFSQRMLYTLHGMTWWGTPCCYCGDPSEEEEHVLPLSAYKKLLAVGNFAIPDDLLRIVPSCKECNGLVGDKVFRTFEEKRLYVKACISRRYHGVLEYPHWQPEELTELDGELYRWIVAGQNMRDLVFERLRF